MLRKAVKFLTKQYNIPVLLRTVISNFEDFPGSKMISRTFRPLKMEEKISELSRIFQDAGDPGQKLFRVHTIYQPHYHWLA
jgi:hypothetical protein